LDYVTVQTRRNDKQTCRSQVYNRLMEGLPVLESFGGVKKRPNFCPWQTGWNCMGRFALYTDWA